MSETPELLPLGSAVTIADDDGVYIIVARGFQKPAEGFLAGYKAVPHPQGAAGGVKEVVIRQTQIAEVVHRGFENPDDAVFAKNQLEHAKAPPERQPSDAEPDLTVDLSKPAVLPAVAPPTSEPASPGGAAINPNDPFSELRSKGKRK
ncbi:DUF4176 domain-containing protein [Leifsonia sp. 71-9]|uniref:DUF4176 domain-containing protein n=1 Tax=Leifsonia sp. 71-9 TaxID=1895934 RepID=UPI0009286DD5|nr:DUF4176 domain-containing protein [Leifsonia sp. 71-9]OJX78152.1 MAG: hypothetical protein BGO91_09820 [Leifsonia sp. 71-9]